MSHSGLFAYHYMKTDDVALVLFPSGLTHFGLCWCCAGVALELRWSCDGVALELRWSCAGVALECLCLVTYWFRVIEVCVNAEFLASDSLFHEWGECTAMAG